MSIEERLTALEQQIARLTRHLEQPRKVDWTKRVIGSFADCSEFDEVLRLGREFRKRQNEIPAIEESDADEAKDRL
jgi:hypothetical protein